MVQVLPHAPLQTLQQLARHPHLLLGRQNVLLLHACSMSRNHSAVLQPPETVCALSELPEHDVDATALVAEENVVRNAQLYQLVGNDPKDKAQRTCHLRSVQVLADRTEHKSLSNGAVKLADLHSHAVLSKCRSTRLIYSLGFTRLVFRQRVDFCF